MDGEVQLLYMSPEIILSSPTWREVFRNYNFQENIVCLAVDEAHLIEKWCAGATFYYYVVMVFMLGKIKMQHHYTLCRGEKFRTDFSHIGEVRSLFPRGTNLLALTATANLSTRKMVIANLEMHGCYVSERIYHPVYRCRKAIRYDGSIHKCTRSHF